MDVNEERKTGKDTSRIPKVSCVFVQFVSKLTDNSVTPLQQLLHLYVLVSEHPVRSCSRLKSYIFTGLEQYFFFLRVMASLT